MPELLLELFSEEIPARFQRKAAEELKKAVTDALVERGLVYESAKAFATPRRLALAVGGVPAASPDTREERKGPRVGSPQQAIDGFLRGAGLSSIDEAKVESDPKKGEFYVALIEKEGEQAQAILNNVLPQIIKSFAWAKPMRWGGGTLQWVRPLRAITATFGTENDEPEVLQFDVDGLAASNEVFGHRFLAPNWSKVKRYSDYVDVLEKSKVVLDLDRRMDLIRADAAQMAFAHGFSVIEDEGLLEEVAGLVEWPVVLMGSFDEAYLELPEEVIILTIKANQKCFCLRENATGKLTNKFLLTANTEAKDGGKTIIAGNERVIHARLSDAQFFYRNDLGTPLEQRLPKLKEMVFHQKLGTQADRVERIVALAGEIAPQVDADVELAKRAAKLAKADLVTEMVFEFPELQGLMGRYYAAAQGEDPSVANAIEMHYKPLGPSDEVPTDAVAIAVALADKLDVLTGFWAIDEKPTGSRDPFALRRAALGVIRLITENGLTFPLSEMIPKAHLLIAELESGVSGGGGDEAVLQDLLSFFHDRLKVSLRDHGARHDLVDAVIAEDSDDVLEISRRVGALSALLEQEDGQSLLAGYKRAANILAAEEKKDEKAYTGEIDTSALSMDEELSLARAVAEAHSAVSELVADNNYAGAIGALAKLRKPVDAFFEAVLVNDPDAAVRANRLNLLARLRDTMHLVADFSKVSG